MLLAIDVGNTCVKIENSRGGHKIALTEDVKSRKDAAALIEPITKNELRIIGCSVVPSVAKVFDQACKMMSGHDPVWINAFIPLGVNILYKSPETLGSDRIANVIGALTLAKPPCIVVDVGTATKLEAIDQDGNYLGGSIMPGIAMSLKNLNLGTAQLPLITATWPLHPIGDDTESSMMTGTVLAHAHGIAGLIRDYETRIGPSTIIFTGGARTILMISDRVGPFKGMNIIDESRLTTIGLQAAARRLGIS